MAAPAHPPRWATGAVVGGALACLAALFLPWVHSGERARNAFEAARTARALGALEGPFDGAVRALAIVPLLVAVVWLAVAVRWWRTAAAAALAVSCTAAAAGYVVLDASITSGVAPMVSLGAASAAAIGAAGMFITGRVRK